MGSAPTLTVSIEASDTQMPVGSTPHYIVKRQIFLTRPDLVRYL